MRFALASCLLLAACTVGDVGTIGSSNTNAPDAGNGPGPGSGSGTGIDPNACVNRVAPADIAHEHGGQGGPTHAGDNCIVSGCHQNNALGPNAPGFQFAGTVYVAGTTNPNIGATVRIKSGTGAPLKAVTDMAGNFYFPSGSLQGAFTATTDVTACPTVTPMVTQLQGGNGGGPGANSCNLCHSKVAGAVTTPISL